MRLRNGKAIEETQDESLEQKNKSAAQENKDQLSDANGVHGEEAGDCNHSNGSSNSTPGTGSDFPISQAVAAAGIAAASVQANGTKSVGRIFPSSRDLRYVSRGVGVRFKCYPFKIIFALIT